MKPRMKKLHEQRDIVVDDCLAGEIGDAKKHLRLEINSGVSISNPRLISLCDLRQEPRSPFALVDPNLDQTGGRDIIVPVTDFVSCAQRPR